MIWLDFTLIDFWKKLYTLLYEMEGVINIIIIIALLYLFSIMQVLHPSQFIKLFVKLKYPTKTPYNLRQR